MQNGSEILSHIIRGPTILRNLRRNREMAGLDLTEIKRVKVHPFWGGVGPNQVVDIKRNDLEKRGAFGSISAFWGQKERYWKVYLGTSGNKDRGPGAGSM